MLDYRLAKNSVTVVHRI